MNMLLQSKVIKVFTVVLLHLLLLGCRGKNDEQKMNQTSFVFDNASILKENEIRMLSALLDSINSSNDLELIYYSIENAELIPNTDSLAERQFRSLSIADKGGLIFLSEATSSFKVVVGKKIHAQLNNEELNAISEEMLVFFKEHKFYAGLKHGFLKLASNVVE